MAQVEQVKPISFRSDPFLWRKFKARIYESGWDISSFMTRFIKKFVEDPEFRERILEELRG